MFPYIFHSDVTWFGGLLSFLMQLCYDLFIYNVATLWFKAHVYHWNQFIHTFQGCFTGNGVAAVAIFNHTHITKGKAWGSLLKYTLIRQNYTFSKFGDGYVLNRHLNINSLVFFYAGSYLRQLHWDYVPGLAISIKTNYMLIVIPGTMLSTIHKRAFRMVKLPISYNANCALGTERDCSFRSFISTKE